MNGKLDVYEEKLKQGIARVKQERQSKEFGDAVRGIRYDVKNGHSLACKQSTLPSTTQTFHYTDRRIKEELVIAGQYMIKSNCPQLAFWRIKEASRVWDNFDNEQRKVYGGFYDTHPFLVVEKEKAEKLARSIGKVAGAYAIKIIDGGQIDCYPNEAREFINIARKYCGN